MKKNIKRDKLLFILNVIFAMFLLFICIRHYITFEGFFIFSFLGFFVPYLVLANLLFMLYWLLKKKKELLLSLSVVIFGYFANDTFFKANNSNKQIKEEISLLTFNSNSFSGFYGVDNPNINKEIVAFVNNQNPDIVCFQEFKRNMYDQFVNYPYKFQATNLNKNILLAIFSKYPLISSGSLNFENTSNNAIYSDVLIKNDTIRLYNLHLESFKVRPGSIKREAPSNIFNRMNLSFQKQLEQAKYVKEHSLKVNYKKVICGDFNSTQFSTVYDTIKGEMKDSFLEEGAGFGNTYYFKFLPFRIDYILTDLDITSHKNFDVLLSDHKPVMASFQLID